MAARRPSVPRSFRKERFADRYRRPVHGTSRVKPRTAADIPAYGEIPAIEYTKAKINELKAGNYEVEATLVAVYQKGLLFSRRYGLHARVQQ